MRRERKTAGVMYAAVGMRRKKRHHKKALPPRVVTLSAAAPRGWEATWMKQRTGQGNDSIGATSTTAWTGKAPEDSGRSLRATVRSQSSPCRVRSCSMCSRKARVGDTASDDGAAALRDGRGRPRRVGVRGLTGTTRRTVAVGTSSSAHRGGPAGM